MEWLLNNWQLIVAVIIGVYEVLARVFPTIGDITILGNIIKLLKLLSDNLNRTKK